MLQWGPKEPVDPREANKAFIATMNLFTKPAVKKAE